MRPSRHLVVVGVGMVLALGHGAPGYTQSTQESTVTQEGAQSAAPGSIPSPTLSTVPESKPVDSGVEPLKVESEPAKSHQNPAAKAIAAPTPAKPAAKKTTAKSSAKAKSKIAQRVKKPIATAPRPVKPLPAESLTAQTPPSTPPASGSMSAPGTMPGLSPNSSTPNSDSTITDSKPIGPAKQGSAPEYLDSDPNPLSFPTKPEEVKVRGIQPITLQQAIDQARRNNRDLQVAYQQLQRSRASLREQNAALYPSLGLQGGITHSRSASGQIQQETAQQAQANIPQSLRQGANSELSSTSFNSALQLTYDIYTGGRRPAAIRAAEQQLRSDELQYEITLSQLRLDTSNAYYDLQQADENVRIQQSAVRNAEASLKDTVALETAGLGTRFDVLQSRVQLANSQQALNNAFATQRIQRQTLVQLLAVPPTIELAAADPVEPAGNWNLTIEQTTVLALKSRAELEQNLAQRELANQQRKGALSALNPTVAFTFQLNALNNLRDQVGFGYGYTAQLNYNWNFFDGGAARARAKQQEINMSIAETRFADTREKIILAVQTAYANLLSSSTNISTARLAVQQSTEALRLARLRFQAGVGTQTDVVNSENNLTQSRGNLVTAILGYNRALASLTRAVTNLPIPTGSTQPTTPVPAQSTN